MDAAGLGSGSEGGHEQEGLQEHTDVNDMGLQEGQEGLQKQYSPSYLPQKKCYRNGTSLPILFS